MPLSVFICYRELDSGHAAGRINYWLKSKLRDDVTLFMDVDNIRKGEDFVEKLDAAIRETDVLLAIIGPHWLDATDSLGNRRIDLEDDFVRTEIAIAIQRNIAIMPVMIDGAKPPKQRELPEPIAKLARYNGVEIRSRSFEIDAAVLLRELQRRASPPRASFFERFRKRAAAKDKGPSKSRSPAKSEPETTGHTGATSKEFETTVETNPNVQVVDEAAAAIANPSKAGADSGCAEPPTEKRQTSWFDVKSWSYFKIAVAAVPIGMISGWMLDAHLYVGDAKYSSLLSAYRAVYAGAIVLLMAKLAIRQKIANLFFAFISLYILFFLTTFATNLIGAPSSIMSALATTVRVAVLWLIVASFFRSPKYAVRDKKMLTVAIAVGAVQTGLQIVYEMLSGKQLPNVAIGGFVFCITALMLTYGIRRATHHQFAVPLVG